VIEHGIFVCVLCFVEYILVIDDDFKMPCDQARQLSIRRLDLEDAMCTVITFPRALVLPPIGMFLNILAAHYLF